MTEKINKIKKTLNNDVIISQLLGYLNIFIPKIKKTIFKYPYCFLFFY